MQNKITEVQTRTNLEFFYFLFFFLSERFKAKVAK